LNHISVLFKFLHFFFFHSTSYPKLKKTPKELLCLHKKGKGKHKFKKENKNIKPWQGKMNHPRDYIAENGMLEPWA
jgi:hypothetical protein